MTQQQDSIPTLDDFLSDDFLKTQELYGSEIPVAADTNYEIGTTKAGRKVLVKPREVTKVNLIVGDDKTQSEYTNIIERGEKVKLEKVQKYETVGTIPNALSKHAKERLESFLKKSPQFKVIEAQLEILKIELHNYKALGQKDLYNTTKTLIDNLEVTKNRFVKLYKDKNWKDEKAINDEKIKNSEVLKQLKLKRKELENIFININPNSIISRLRNMRQLMVINYPEISQNNELDYFASIDDSSTDNEEVLNIDDYIEEDDKLSTISLKQEYDNLCAHIGEIVDLSTAEVANYNLNKLKNLLLVAIPEGKVKEVINQLETIKFQTASEISKLKGNQEITNIMFEIFDFDTVSEQQPKEMLAASNVEYVKSVAYNSCSKLNMMHYYDDAIAYGLLGLSVAIDAWYKVQKIKDSAVSFTGFSHQYVSNAIKRGMYELGSGGMISGSNIANKKHFYDAQVNSFLTNNPELKDLPKEMIESMLDGLTNIQKAGQVVTEGAYVDTIGGGDTDGAGDIWTNASVSEMDAEVAFEYEDLYKSVKQLFNLFETKVDNETGLKEITKKKLFNKFDYKLFKLKYGLEYKRDVIGGGQTKANNLYNQEEIAQVLSDYYASFGVTNKKFSQSAISTRINELNKKLQAAVAENPSLKHGLQHIYTYIQANCEEIDVFGNSETKEVENILADGKRLNSVYQQLNQNPLDSEIQQINNF